MRDRIDPRRYNGAMFLGLTGIAVKSHGGTTHSVCERHRRRRRYGFNGFNEKITEGLRGLVE